MADENPIFEQVAQLASSDGAEAAVDTLITHLTANHEYHELFEAKKMRLRLSLGLPAAQAQHEERCDEELELKLERGLLEACREVGELFFAEGRVREGWMYLRPVGDREVAAKAIACVEPNDDNADELLEVLVHEGVDVARGYQMALDRLGTCNSITLFESALAARPREDQKSAAGLLVRHVHRELVENLRGDIQRREGQAPSGSTAADLLADRGDLLSDGTYHLDTSHLASTVRFARVLDDTEVLELARDIAYYGSKLHPQFQYPGEEPFLDLYPASLAFFGALLGDRVDAGIRFFQQKADSVPQQDFGVVAVEVLIDLLSRCGRHEEALAAYEKRLPADARTMGIAPTLLQLSQRLGNFDKMQSISRDRGDLLGFVAATLQNNP
ncbi:MAG TPA: hypothetical protein DDW52_13860 [Planctomycetaceae bacterium]|nr:hypothetical protein [Planctomycetaceae bacterium]